MTINHLQSTTYKAINVETILDSSCNCNVFIFLSGDQHDWCLTNSLRNSQVPNNIA